MLLNLYRDCQSNVGDKASTPVDYFDLGPVERKDFWGITSKDLEGRQILLGGGGLAIFREALEVLAPHAANCIVWGIGCNQAINKPTKPTLPSLLSNCPLVGVRDWGTPYDWVPCASCMSPLFDQPRQVQHDVGFYGHYDIALKDAGQPYLANNCTFAEAVAFLGSCETIVTNSYHGAYWATLLGCKVLVWPVNTKLFCFRHQPRVIQNMRWQQNIQHAVAYPNSLAECRQANCSFYAKVLALV